jgi:hypothetical protein
MQAKLSGMILTLVEMQLQQIQRHKTTSLTPCGVRLKAITRFD